MKTDAERAAPNALLHEIIAKMPNPDNSTLKLKKEEYEDKLYKAEMHGGSPPPGVVTTPQRVTGMFL